MHATATDAITTNVVAARKDTPFTDMLLHKEQARADGVAAVGLMSSLR